MDTSHEILYNMSDKNSKQVASKEIPEDIRKLVYEHSIEIQQLKERQDHLGQLHEIINDMKSGMAIIKSGTNADLMVMKSYFTTKIESLSDSLNIQIKALNDTFDLKLIELKNTITENNSRLKWVRNILFSIVIVIPSTLLIGVKLTNSTNESYQQQMSEKIDIYQDHISSKLEIFIQTVNLKDSMYEQSISEIKQNMKEISQSIKK